MISAVAALDTKPVKPFSCHLGENGNMEMYHVSPVSCLLQSGAEDCSLELTAAAASMYRHQCHDNVTISCTVALGMQTWHCHLPASSDVQTCLLGWHAHVSWDDPA